MKKGVLKNFAKFTGKHLCQSLLFNKVAGLSNLKKKPVKNTHEGMLLLVSATLLKVTLLHGCFSRFLNCTNGAKSRKAFRISN